jgi:hypothetical protein
MKATTEDARSQARRDEDERIAAESPLPAPQLPNGSRPAPMESHLDRLRRRPVALEGVVENGLVRLLDPSVKLAEKSRVIIVASQPT